MKKILVLLLFSFGLQAQTTFKQVDIDAASGNDYETLLTNIVNVLYSENNYHVDNLLNDLGYNNITYLEPVKKGYDYTIKYDKENNKKVTVYVHYIAKNINNTSVVNKVEIYGNLQAIIRFYINFWSRQLNFNDVKPGEVVSTRFLTDVATLSYPGNNTAKITVVTAKDR